METEADITRRRHVNSRRFSWHEHLLRDPGVNKRPNALVIAGHLMHRFRPDLGYAEVSHGEVARLFYMPVASSKRSMKFLIDRGWVIVVDQWKPGAGHRANRYAFGNGPEGLSLADHEPGIYDETV
ncbi:MAG: hypothetical protein U1E49_20750 [Hyphomicrobiaceae bacterium]